MTDPGEWRVEDRVGDGASLHGTWPSVTADPDRRTVAVCRVTERVPGPRLDAARGRGGPGPGRGRRDLGGPAVVGRGSGPGDPGRPGLGGRLGPGGGPAVGPCRRPCLRLAGPGLGGCPRRCRAPRHDRSPPGLRGLHPMVLVGLLRRCRYRRGGHRRRAEGGRTGPAPESGRRAGSTAPACSGGTRRRWWRSWPWPRPNAGRPPLVSPRRWWGRPTWPRSEDSRCRTVRPWPRPSWPRCRSRRAAPPLRRPTSASAPPAPTPHHPRPPLRTTPAPHSAPLRAPSVGPPRLQPVHLDVLDRGATTGVPLDSAGDPPGGSGREREPPGIQAHFVPKWLTSGGVGRKVAQSGVKGRNLNESGSGHCGEHCGSNHQWHGSSAGTSTRSTTREE